MGKSKSKSSAKAEPVKKCTCDHPFKCECGNRPERPSKGHKWDSSTQQWGGKGHKQKGASIQAASIGQAEKVTKVGGVAIKQWQKLPSDLLKELCKKHGFGMPQYRRMDKAKDGKDYRFKLIVPSGKKGTTDHDVVLSPSLAVPNEEQAKEEAALLGLLYVFPKLPHERTLPEPYRGTFLEALKNSQSAGGDDKSKNGKKESGGTANCKDQKKERKATVNTQSNIETSKSSNARTNTQLTANLPAFHTSRNNISSQSTSGPLLTKAQLKEAKLQHQRQVQARIRKHEAIRNANKPMEVFMCASMRRRIERLLAGDSPEDVMEEEEEEEDDYEVLIDGEEEDVIQSYVVQRLVHEGFTPPQVRKGYRAISDRIVAGNDNSDSQMDKAYEETLQYLCIHLNEDQLPIGFDPRGGTLDVVRPLAKTKTTANDYSKVKDSLEAENDDQTTYDDAVLQFASKFCLTPIEASAILSTKVEAKPTSNISGSKELMQKWKFWNVLCRAASLPIERSCFVESNDNVLSSDDHERNTEAASNEIEALEAIFCDQGFHTTKLCNRTTLISIELPQNDPKLCLEVIYSDGYPDFLPMVFLTNDNSSEFRRGGQLHVQMTEFLSSLEPGIEAIFELFGHVQELLQDDEEKSSLENTSMLLSELNLDNVEAPTKGSKKEITPTNKENSNHFETPAARKQSKPSRRPREKSAFWNTSPTKTPPAESFPKLPPILEKARKSLPAAKARDEFLSLMKKAGESGRVMLVTGETGCGKTTQIPQFILENSPADSKIVVAQPRRLAATGVATRVAIERGESRAGLESVGYSVRGDSKTSAATRLMFCTTGVLLRQLQSQDALGNITHIIIDEVHERHLDSDVLLAILKRVLPENPHLNIVLMSATMDADRFASYWGNNTPRMHIPGFTHPVQDFMLEDVLRLTGYVPPKKKGKPKVGHGSYQIQSSFVDNDLNASVDDPAQSSSTLISVEDRIKRMDLNEIDYDLLVLFIQYLLEEKNDDGSILVFLPGVGEIERAERSINQKRMNSISVLPLHGGLQPEKQNQIFAPAPAGKTKVILSTNVAETSITIPDCTMVIDTCKEKQSSFDPVNRMPLLLERFASQDSLRQRRGRAGRVRPGVCYKLITGQHHSKLQAHGTPEIKRCALEQTILSLLFLGLEDGSGEFLCSMIDPPSKESINSALDCLEQLGAIEKIDGVTNLCPLGRHLAGIPAPPTVGKLLVMGSLFGCRNISLAIAAGMSVGRSPFMRISSSPFQAKRNTDCVADDEKQVSNEQILEARRTLFKSVGNSEHCMLGKAYLLWDEAKGVERRKYCERLGLAFNNMREMKQLVHQLNNSLASLGFVENGDCDAHANSWRVVRAIVVSALSPSQVIRVQRPTTKYTETVEGAVEKDGKAQDFKFFIRSGENDTSEQEEERVFIHPGCNMFSVGSFSCPWLVYHRMVRTSKAYIHDATEGSAYALLLFGGKMEVQASKGLVVLDSRIELSANARIGSLIGGLRKKIDDLLDKKVANPFLDISDTPEMKIIVHLLMFDGLGR